jgi:hypothetical protein
LHLTPDEVWADLHRIREEIAAHDYPRWANFRVELFRIS